MIHGAELRVHFLKSFQKGSTCENLSQKGLKTKKRRPGGQQGGVISGTVLGKNIGTGYK
jgi:hypothetical protein